MKLYHLEKFAEYVHPSLQVMVVLSWRQIIDMKCDKNGFKQLQSSVITSFA